MQSMIRINITRHEEETSFSGEEPRELEDPNNWVHCLLDKVGGSANINYIVWATVLFNII